MRQQQEQRTSDAAQDVRGLDHAKWNESVQQREPVCRRWCCTREQQDDAGDERECGENARREPLRHTGDGARQARGVMAPLADLRAGKNEECDCQRRKVVDDPIRDERWRQLDRCHIRLQQQDDDALEDADATGHVRRQSENLRRDECAQHDGKRRGTARQQDVEHCAGQRPVK